MGRFASVAELYEKFRQPYSENSSASSPASSGFRNKAR
jgi:hypothetical protein